MKMIDQIKIVCPDAHQATLGVLADMYSLNELHGTESDKPVPIDNTTRITIDQGAMINELMRAHDVKHSLEVGFAYGFSTIWMLDALRRQKNSFHIAIDPFEKEWWRGIGLAQVAKLDFDRNFQWIEDYSIHALSDLIRKQTKFDFVYIDGNHRFDDVIVDFYLSDQVVRPGGLIALDDMWMKSVRTAVNFVTANRAYDRVNQPVAHMTVLKKRHDDDRDWQHFNQFETAGSDPIESVNTHPTRENRGTGGLYRTLTTARRALSSLRKSI